MAKGRRAIVPALSAVLFFSFTSSSVSAQLDCTGVCDPAIGLVPVGASGPHSIFGRDILLSPGQVVQLEVRIANWDSDGDGDPLLSAWVLRVPGEDFSTGTGVVGALAPLAPICTTDELCQEEVHPLSSCGAAYDDPDLLRCAPAVFDSTRPDYIFAGGVDLPAVDPSEFPSIRMASVVITDPAADPG